LSVCRQGAIGIAGHRHPSYGVEPCHFELAGIALLASLDANLGALRPRHGQRGSMFCEILAEAIVAAMRSMGSSAHQSRKNVSRFTATTGVPP
jgi:hypothetical protein